MPCLYGMKSGACWLIRHGTVLGRTLLCVQVMYTQEERSPMMPRHFLHLSPQAVFTVFWCVFLLPLGRHIVVSLCMTKARRSTHLLALQAELARRTPSSTLDCLLERHTAWDHAARIYP